jgi:cell division protein FtsB
MNHILKRKSILLLYGFTFTCGTVFSQPTLSIDDEISRLRKEIKQTTKDCKRIEDEIQKDKKDFEAYQLRTSQRLAQTKKQIDTLKSDILTQSQMSNEMASKIADLQGQQREIELSQEEFRNSLVTLCEKLQSFVTSLPPLSCSSIKSALAVLTNDISTKSIDIIEGCARIVQICNKFDETSSSVQISQESSPFPEIAGLVYRLRIGTIFEALVDTKGEKCALFEGWSEKGIPRWKKLESVSAAQAILLAVNIREGKALPAFVNIPFISDYPEPKGGAQ